MTLPILLSVIAGSTDVIGFLGLNGLFTAHITGNIVVLAAHLVIGEPGVISYLLSVPVFMIVLFVTRVAAFHLGRFGAAPLRPLLLLQLLLLLGCLELGAFAGPWQNPNVPSAILAGMLGVSAMAVQNALTQIAFRNVPSTAVMTTNVTHFMLDLSDLLTETDEESIARARQRAGRTGPLILGFAFGCAIGAAYEATAGLWSLALPTGLAVVALVIA